MNNLIDEQLQNEILGNSQQNNPSNNSMVDQNLQNEILGIKSADTTETHPVVSKAKGYIGNQDYNGMCQQFVGDVTGNKTKGASAVDAWDNNLDKAVPNTQGMKAGDMVYLLGNSPDAPGQSFDFGHAGIYEGNGMFISATDNGVKEENLDKWTKDNNQTVIGYIPNR